MSAPGDEDPTSDDVGALPSAIEVTTPVARAAKRRQSLAPPQGPSGAAPAPAPEPAPDPEPTSQRLTTPTAALTPPAPLVTAPLTIALPRRDGIPAAVHSHPTQQIARLGTDSAGDSRMASAISPLDAMRDDEINRMRMFLRLIAAATLFTVIAIAMTPGDHIAKIVVYAGAAVVGASALFLIWRMREDGSGYNPRLLSIGAVVMVIGASGGIYYWGVASPASALYVYGIYVFSLGGELAVILLVYLLVAAIHLGLSVAIMSGLTIDRGIVTITQFELRQQIGIVFVAQALFLLALITARANRRTTFDTVTKLERAVRSVSQREAMLAEVRLELDRALKVGGPGRYTDQIVGSFRLGMLIGRGGMGEVYEGTSVHDGREAAVKLLHPSTLADPHQVLRFVREAEVAARIDCPNVVSVLEVGTTSGEIPFIAMERLRGFDLAHQLRRHRTLQLAQLVELVHQIAHGLEAARAAGIVHRDLKPHNLFLAEQDGQFTWKVLDFGVSKLTSHHGTLTQGHVVGTPSYMAPEQARGDEVDHRADVYALAAIIYRCVTGHPPFTGKDVPSTLYDVVYKQPTQPSLLAQLPSDLDRVIALGMAKNAGDRLANATDLAAAFTLAARGDLPIDTRRRADALIEKFPWGARI